MKTKQPSKSKKLVLAKTTIRELTPSEMARAGGGFTEWITTIFSQVVSCASL